MHKAFSEITFDLRFQLSTIYETKPPISKAKVASVTRLAVKAIKVSLVSIENLLTSENV